MDTFRSSSDITGSNVTVSDDVEISRFKKAYTNNVIYVDDKLEKDDLLLNWHVSKEKLEKAGVICAFGKWTKSELDILKNNVQQFQAVNDIREFPKFFKDLKNETGNGMSYKDVVQELGENINRPIRYIRDKLNLLYIRDEHVNYSIEGSRFTKSEIRQLVSLQKKHGNNWSLIGEMMGRSKSSVYDKYSKIKGIVKNLDEEGKELNTVLIPGGDNLCHYTSAEDKKIREVVERIAADENGNIDYQKINWPLVSAHVGTRTATSCRQRWRHYIALNKSDNNETDDVGEIKIRRRENITAFNMLAAKILRILIIAGIDDKDNIDWNSVVTKLEGNHDEQVLRKRFFQCIHCNVPDYKNKTFQQQLEFLLKKIRLYELE